MLGSFRSIRRVGPLRLERGRRRIRDVSPHRRSRRGFTVLELIVVLSMMGLVLSISLPRFRDLSNELENAARELGGFFRQARAEAMTTTSAYRVIANSNRSLRTEYAASCAAPDDEDWTLDGDLSLEMRERSSLLNIAADSILICFNTRGVGDANPILTVERAGDVAEVEVFLGGGVVVTPFPSDPEE